MNRLVLRTAEAIEAQKRVKERLSLSDIAKTGYHFCQSCQKVTEDIGTDGPFPKCCWCGSSRLKYCPKV